MSGRRRRPQRMLLPALRRVGPAREIRSHAPPATASVPDPDPGRLPDDAGRDSALHPPETAPPPALHPPETAPPVSPALDPAVIRRSLAGITAGPQQVAGDFYGYLFAACPELRGMFPPQMTAQNERLLAALMKIAQLLDSPDALARYLTQLGRDHRKYGVAPEHYTPVGEALLAALRRRCPSWDDAAEAAWAAAYGAASGAMIAAAATASGPAYWTGTVTRHETRAHGVAVLEVRTSAPLEFEPGQYVTVQTGKWHRVWRQFSVACPADLTGDRLELHVRQVPGGWVSTALVRDTRPGDKVIIGPPAGTMTTEEAGGRDLLLVAGGTGLAPLKAVAGDILGRDEAAMSGGWGHRRRVDLFCGARSPLELYDMPALRELERDYPWFQVHPVISGEPRYDGLKGDVADVALAYDSWPDREVFIAGPSAMTASAIGGFRSAGTPESRVHFDDLDGP